MCVPVALFVHSRLDHTMQTVAALQQNELADQTPLYIFSDGAREHKEGEREAVKAVRDYLATITGFLSVNIIERPENWGLKRNIIDGLNTVTSQYESVIVVEDDCVTSPDFLQYMNQQLKAFECDEAIWHIAGWSPGLNVEGDIYCSHFMSCWGWATWSKCWSKLNLDTLALMRKMKLMDRYRFNLNNCFPFYSHLLGNYLGQNNTWAVYWAASIFTQKGECLNPVGSRVFNAGMDGSGSHDALAFEQISSGKSIIEKNKKNMFASQLLRRKLAQPLSLRQKILMYLKMLPPVCFWVLCKRALS